MILSHRTYLIVIGCLVLGIAMTTAQAQKPTRAEAIARIAQMYPNSAKSPEQIYEEGQAWQAVQRFSKRLKYKDTISLTGILEEDTYQEVPNGKHFIANPTPATPQDSSMVRTGVDETSVETTIWGAGQDTTSRDAGQDTTQVTPPEQPNFTTIQKIPRRIPEPGKRDFVTIDARQADASSRKALRGNLEQLLFEKMPAHVLIDLTPKSVIVNGNAATVEADYVFVMRERETPESRPFKEIPKTVISLQMQKDGDEWFVTNMAGITAQFLAVVPR